MYQITLNKNSWLTDPVAKVGRHIITAIYETYAQHPTEVNQIEIVVNHNFHDWLLENWGRFYLNQEYVAPSRFGWLFSRLGLPDYFETTLRVEIAEDELKWIRNDILKHQRVIAFGIYFKLILNSDMP